MACLRWVYGWSRSVITTAGITSTEIHVHWHITDDGADALSGGFILRRPLR